MNPRMEAPFYHDDALNVAFGPAESAMPFVLSAASVSSAASSSSSSSSVSSHAAAAAAVAAVAAAAKKKLTLNLHDPSGSLKPHLRAAEQQGGLLKLASPELEHLIIQSGNGLVTTTPTPTQFLCPRNVTDEQEGFADGFVKALEELHKQNQLSGAASPAAVAAAVAAAAAVCAPGGQQQQQQQQSVGPGTSEAPVYATLNSYGHQQQPHQSQQGFGFGAFPLAHPRLTALKEEPQTVPELGSSPPPLSPIDMETQERIKAERKRLRNRIAASKCRKRKLERIARLEDRVKALKAQNSDLATTAGALREQVASLKQKVMKHVNSGCRLMINQQMQGF